MAASFLSRRLTSRLLLRNPRISPHLAALSRHFSTLSAPVAAANPRPQSLLQQIQPRSVIPAIPTTVFRHFCSTPTPDTPPEFRHQEIVGPTVDRDVSALANQTRETLDAMRKSISGLSSALALVGCAHLGLGAWIAYAARPGSEVVSVQGLMAFAFPVSMAFLMRRTLKPIGFLSKMEEQGRLQVLTLALQVSKHLNLLFLRMRVVSIGCAVGVSAGSLVAIYWRYPRSRRLRAASAPATPRSSLCLIFHAPLRLYQARDTIVSKPPTRRTCMYRLSSAGRRLGILPDLSSSTSSPSALAPVVKPRRLCPAPLPTTTPPRLLLVKSPSTIPRLQRPGFTFDLRDRTTQTIDSRAASSPTSSTPPPISAYKGSRNNSGDDDEGGVPGGKHPRARSVVLDSRGE